MLVWGNLQTRFRKGVPSLARAQFLWLFACCFVWIHHLASCLAFLPISLPVSDVSSAIRVQSLQLPLQGHFGDPHVFVTPKLR